MTKKRPSAFSFKCTLDQETIWTKFDAVGAFEWMGGDSEHYGLYLRARPISPDWPVRLRVYGETPPDYLLEFNYSWHRLHEGADPDPVIEFVKNKLLPAIGATDVKPTDGIR